MSKNAPGKKVGKKPKITADARRHMVDEMVAKLKNPMQPVYEDEMGRTRFKANKIVRALLDQELPSGIGPLAKTLSLNDLAAMNFSVTDWLQFYQLIGYGLDCYAELGTEGARDARIAEQVWEADQDPRDARIEILETQLRSLRSALREPMAMLYEKHPDDLMEDER